MTTAVIFAQDTQKKTKKWSPHISLKILNLRFFWDTLQYLTASLTVCSVSDEEPSEVCNIFTLFRNIKKVESIARIANVIQSHSLTPQFASFVVTVAVIVTVTVGCSLDSENFSENSLDPLLRFSDEKTLKPLSCTWTVKIDNLLM